MKIAIVGASSGSHLGASFARAAEHLNFEHLWFDTNEAARGNKILRALRWRYSDRRPLRLEQFSAEVVETCALTRPQVLVATGAALTASALHALHNIGVISVNYSTDDPWNASSRAEWHLRALPAYQVVFTPRRANLEDLHRLGCPKVHYMPFGYDDTLFFVDGIPRDAALSHDVLFVGGADRDRAGFVTEFMRSGPPVALAGGYWDRYSETRPYALGLKTIDELRALTIAAKVNLCLVRRANRDGHVMRSFEIGALGGCMLAEDTAEHRALFGPDGECVWYFRTPQEASSRSRELLNNSGERRRLATAVHLKVTEGAHTYRHRLATMVKFALEDAWQGTSPR
jgi:spore maturation protein CgeB